MSWTANWYKRGDVVIGKESVTVSNEGAESVIISTKGESVTISKELPISVTIRNNEKDINVSDNSVSIII